MDLEDGFDDILAEISEPTSPKQPRLDKPGTSSDGVSKPASSKTHCVLVNQKQRGNPLLKFVTSVPWEYDDIIPDYEIGKTICLLFLSVRYHNLNPDYINNRLKELGKKYELRVLLVQVDLKDPHSALKNLTRICLLTDMTLMLAWSPEEAAKVIENYKIYENKPPDRIMEKIENDPQQKVDLKDPHSALKNLTRICLLTDMTLMLAWSPEEAAKVIENYKIYENKPPDRIMEKIENDPQQKIINALSSIKPVNKTDAMTLLTTFGTLANIIKATESRLADCPGFGATKAKKLYKALHEPFLKKGNVDKDEFSGDISIEDVEKLEQEAENQDNKAGGSDDNS